MSSQFKFFFIFHFSTTKITNYYRLPNITELIENTARIFDIKEYDIMTNCRPLTNNQAQMNQMDTVINYMCFMNQCDSDFLNKAVEVLYCRYPFLNSVIIFKDGWHFYVNKPFSEASSGCRGCQVGTQLVIQDPELVDSHRRLNDLLCESLKSEYQASFFLHKMRVADINAQYLLQFQFAHAIGDASAAMFLIMQLNTIYKSLVAGKKVSRKVVQNHAFSSLSAPDFDYKFEIQQSTFYNLGLDTYDGLYKVEQNVRKLRSIIRFVPTPKFKKLSEKIPLTISLQVTCQMLSAATGFYLKQFDKDEIKYLMCDIKREYEYYRSLQRFKSIDFRTIFGNCVGFYATILKIGRTTTIGQLCGQVQAQIDKQLQMTPEQKLKKLLAQDLVPTQKNNYAYNLSAYCSNVGFFEANPDDLVQQVAFSAVQLVDTTMAHPFSSSIVSNRLTGMTSFCQFVMENFDDRHYDMFFQLYLQIVEKADPEISVEQIAEMIADRMKVLK